MLEFCKRLASCGLQTTFAATAFIFKSFKPIPSPLIQYDTISDGFDEGGFAQAPSVDDYITQLETVGSKTLGDIIKKNSATHPIDCIVYDAHFTWALDVAKKFGITGASFFTQSCTPNYVYYCVHRGWLKLPIPTSAFPLDIDASRYLRHEDMPSFVIDVEGAYPAFMALLLSQFTNIHNADFVLVNSVYEWEKEVVDSLSKYCRFVTVGPTIPSMHLDKRVRDDKEYGFNVFQSESSVAITNWLNNKPQNSVVYASFGSQACLNDKQMEEVALGLKASNVFFLWVVRATEQSKLPHNYASKTCEKGLIVKWCPQMEVLSHPSVGCFLTHCGWNSTVEALSLGVPMVGMPQWTDQPTDAKLVESLWKVKIGGDGIVGRKEIELCIREIMEGDRTEEMRRNAKKWSHVALQAISEGGSSDKNIREFISKLNNRFAN